MKKKHNFCRIGGTEVLYSSYRVLVLPRRGDEVVVAAGRVEVQVGVLAAESDRVFVRRPACFDDRLVGGEREGVVGGGGGPVV